MVQGGFDRHSDLDLVVVVRADAHGEVMQGRKALAGRAGNLLAAFSGEHVGEPRLLICLYGPPLVHVDFKFVTGTDLDVLYERPILLWARDPEATGKRIVAGKVEARDHDPQWFEDRAWIWLHYTATKLQRGELFEAVSGLDYFRDVVLGTLLKREAGLAARGVRRLETVRGAAKRLVTTVPVYDAASVRSALEAAIALYVELRDAMPPPKPVAHMPKALLAFIASEA
jgi:hypothetical protein